MYQDRQPGKFLHAMIAFGSGDEPRTRGPPDGKLQLGT